MATEDQRRPFSSITTSTGISLGAAALISGLLYQGNSDLRNLNATVNAKFDTMATQMREAYVSKDVFLVEMSHVRETLRDVQQDLRDQRLTDGTKPSNTEEPEER
jgi:predicted alpha/beta-fold hydrolase